MTTSPMFHRGQWVDIEIPVVPVEEGGTIEAARDAAGWTKNFMCLGAEPLTIHVWDLPGDAMPYFCVDVMDVISGFTEIYAGDQADVLDLFARWAPMVQAAIMSWIMTEAETARSSATSTTIEAMGRMFAQGMSRTILSVAVGR